MARTKEDVKNRVYTQEEILQAAEAWVSSGGNAEEVGRQLGIPGRTVRYWQKKDVAFRERVSELWNDEATRRDIRMSNSLQSALDELDDRLRNGDEVIVERVDTCPMTGKLVKSKEIGRKKVSAADAARAIGILSDKQAKLQELRGTQPDGKSAFQPTPEEVRANKEAREKYEAWLRNRKQAQPKAAKLTAPAVLKDPTDTRH